MANERELGRTDLTFVDTSPSMRARMLDETSWGRELGWELVRVISDYMSVYEVEPGGLLFSEFARESYLCVLVSGAVHITKEDSNGIKKVMHTLGAGKVLGELGLLDGHPRSATVSAAKKTKVLIFTQNRLAEMMATKPKVASQFILKLARDLSRRLRKTSGMLVDLMNS